MSDETRQWVYGILFTFAGLAILYGLFGNWRELLLTTFY